MRQALTTILELVGGALIAYGAYQAWAPLGYIVGGACLAVVGWLGDR